MTNITKKVAKIIEDVKNFGDQAVIKYASLYDDVSITKSEDLVEKVHINKKLGKHFVSAIDLAIKNVKKFHNEEYKKIKKLWTTKYNGIITGQKFVPLESVGIYIPGGKYGYNYISTLLMAVIPAQVAGVKNVVVVTPPRNVTNYFLYTAYKLGIKEVYKIGGVQAIAALAFGTQTVPKVEMVVGPGNIWVTEAKRQLVGVVGIDLLAGPSEVVVVGDEESNSEEIAYELLAQAEHDKNAKSYFIGLSKNVIYKVKKFITTYALEFLPQIKIIYQPNIDKACELINNIAPEHLTLLTKKHQIFLKKVNNAGAIFYGDHPSAVFGDYIAGPSHVLPTGQTAKFSSGLSVVSFLKKISIVKLSQKAVKSLSPHVITLAKVEGMHWHSERLNKLVIPGETNAKESKGKPSNKRNKC
ncbi:MAG: histidinol dehydrogenase [Endomicrobia bacterium]|nr:histidinol dehydrogenase [Endomicrobiia bacterium]